MGPAAGIQAGVGPKQQRRSLFRGGGIFQRGGCVLQRGSGILCGGGGGCIIFRGGGDVFFLSGGGDVLIVCGGGGDVIILSGGGVLVLTRGSLFRGVIIRGGLQQHRWDEQQPRTPGRRAATVCSGLSQ